MKLKLKNIYIHYDYPIIFSATNEDGNTLICLFVNEEESHLKYICKDVSSSIIADLEDNRKDIRSVFKSPGKLYSFILNAQSEEPINAIETTEDITSFLPEEDFFIGVHTKGITQTMKKYQDGLLEGEKKGIEKTARNALAKGIPIEMIHDITGLEIRVIEQLAV
jgi:hypothetical protein